MPALQTNEGICSHQAEQCTAGWQLAVQFLKCLERVIRRAIGLGSIRQRERKANFIGNRQAGHLKAIRKTRRGALGLEWLRSDGRKQNCIEIQSGPRGSRHRQVSVMRWIEAAAKKRYTLSTGPMKVVQVHDIMVQFPAILVASSSRCAI